MPKPREWSQKELDFLRWNYGKLGAPECAERLGRPLQGVRVKAWNMGLKGKDQHFEWTEQRLKLIVDFYPTMFSKALAKWIGCGHRTLVRKARELGLEKVPDFHERKRDEIRRMSGSHGPNRTTIKKGSGIGAEYRFKKGHQLSPESKQKQIDSLKRY